MADCCAELKGELAQLRAEVGRLKPVDEEAIIQKAYEKCKSKLLPFIDEALAAAHTAYELARTVEKIAKAAETVAKAAEAAAKALEAVGKLIPYIPALIALAISSGLIFGFAVRLASAEFRIGVIDRGLSDVNNTLGSVINSVMRLQNELRNLALKPGPKGDKGDRGTPGIKGIDGYTPVKGKDYFDGVNGKDGYSPVKGKDYRDGEKGKDGYTPSKGKDYKDGDVGKQGLEGQRGKDGSPGKAGRTPIKNKDYFDGKDGKDGYTPVLNKDFTNGKDGSNGSNGKDGARGKDGEKGYTPIKGKDYFDGKDGKDGKQGSKGDKGDKGERGQQGIQGRPGEAEMPTDLKPVLNAIASLSTKLSVVSKQVDIVNKSVNIEIAGSIGSESCDSGVEVFDYNGLGLVGIQNQVNVVANTIGKLHEDVCNIYSGGGSGGGITPDESTLLQRIYAIVGGYAFYPTGDETTPLHITNTEVSIKSDALIMFHEDGSEGSPVRCRNLIDLIHASNAVSYYKLGLHEFPASLPESLISKDEGFLGNLVPNPNKDIQNLTKYVTWFVERFDEVVGQWEIPIEIKDSDPSKGGDQPVGIKLPNIAEAIAEMFILCFQTNLNSETLLNMTMRVMGDNASDKQQNFVSYKLLQSLTDYVGFKQKDISMKMPLLFTLGKTKYQDILKESEVDVAVVEFDDKFGLEADLMRFREAAATLAAVHKRKINPNADIKPQVLKYLLDLLASTNKVNKNDDDDNFEQFLNDVEVGFTTAPGMKDSIHPYGRDYTQRPRIRDLNKYKPPTEP